MQGGLQTRLGAKQSECDGLRQELQTRQAERDTAQRERAVLQREREKLGGELQRRQAERDTAQRERAVLQRERAASERERDAMRAQLQTRQAECDAARRELSSLQGELQTRRDAAQQVADRLDVAQLARDALLLELQIERDAAQRMQDALQGELHRREVERDNHFRTELQAVRAEWQARLDGVQRERDELQRALLAERAHGAVSSAFLAVKDLEEFNAIELLGNGSFAMAIKCRPLSPSLARLAPQVAVKFITNYGLSTTKAATVRELNRVSALCSLMSPPADQ
jgi:chromosome segregation ATPase